MRSQESGDRRQELGAGSQKPEAGPHPMRLLMYAPSCLCAFVPALRKLTSSTIKHKVYILVHNFPPARELQIMTPLDDFSSCKYLPIQYLWLCRSREADQKFIKIRKSFVAPNYPPLRGLWQKNFRAPRVNRYDILSTDQSACAGDDLWKLQCPHFCFQCPPFCFRLNADRKSSKKREKFWLKARVTFSLSRCPKWAALYCRP